MAPQTLSFQSQPGSQHLPLKPSLVAVVPSPGPHRLAWPLLPSLGPLAAPPTPINKVTLPVTSSRSPGLGGTHLVSHPHPSALPHHLHLLSSGLSVEASCLVHGCTLSSLLDPVLSHLPWGLTPSMTPVPSEPFASLLWLSPHSLCGCLHISK